MKNGDKVSQLAFGCMRLPRRGRGIDLAASRLLTDRAVDAGVNYFDTAWMYPGSEAAVGQLLAPHRDRVNIATKMPMVLVKKPEDFDKYFAASLERLRTDRVDYYLLHMLTSGGDIEKFASMGVIEWAEREKSRGRIRNLGFSFHGNAGAFKKIIDSYGWDFCMIQYNYIDTEYQAGTGGLMYAAARGVPVLVMEPLRGGKLASVPPEARRVRESFVRFWRGREGASAGRVGAALGVEPSRGTDRIVGHEYHGSAGGKPGHSVGRTRRRHERGRT
jgi:predicted aldo/keto reductase-like oxidoreductase